MSKTPRTFALLENGCTNKELAEHAFQLEEELAAANKRLDDQAGYASDADRYQRELATLRAAAEKLASEFENPGSTVIVNGPQFAAKLRDLLK